jgi:hypothetical protein
MDTAFLERLVVALTSAGIVVHDTAGPDWPTYGWSILVRNKDRADESDIMQALVRGTLALRDPPLEIANISVHIGPIGFSGAQHYTVRFNHRPIA